MKTIIFYLITSILFAQQISVLKYPKLFYKKVNHNYKADYCEWMMKVKYSNGKEVTYAYWCASNIKTAKQAKQAFKAQMWFK